MIERRRGFTMLTVLWLLAVAGAMTLVSATVGRIAIDTGRNRVNIDRARWQAIGCARRAQSALDHALRSAANEAAATRAWVMLDHALPRDVPDCAITLEDAGARLDINSATDEMLGRAFSALGLSGEESDRAIAAIVLRRSASEFDDARQADLTPSMLSLLTAEAGRISLSHASPAVLQSIPGVTAETAQAIYARDMAADPLDALTDILPAVSEASRSELISRYPDASRVTTPVPDAWLLRTQSSAGNPPARATLEWRLTRAADHVTVTRAREVQ